MVKTFRVLPELLKTKSVKKHGKEIASHTYSIKNLNKQQLLEFKKIRKEKEEFLKEIGLIGNNKDKLFNRKAIIKYKQIKQEINELNKKIDNILIKKFKDVFLIKEGIDTLNDIDIGVELTKPIFNKLQTLSKKFDDYKYTKYFDKWKTLFDTRYTKKIFGEKNKHVWSNDVKITQKILDLLYKKMPELKKLYGSQNEFYEDRHKNKKVYFDFYRKYLKILEKEMNNFNEKSKEYLNVLSKKRTELVNHTLYDSRINELFLKRYGVSYSEISNSFSRLRYSGNLVPTQIFGEILNSLNKKNHLLVFPLRSSLFNYYYCDAVIQELNRHGLNKNNLRAVTLTADSFEHHYSKGEGPDVISHQLPAIFRKGKVISTTIMDMQSSGYQYDKIKSAFSRYMSVENNNFGYIDIREHDMAHAGGIGGISPENVIEKNVSSGYGRSYDPNYAYEIPIVGNHDRKLDQFSNRLKAKEMIQVFARLDARAQLKLRRII